MTEKFSKFLLILEAIFLLLPITAIHVFLWDISPIYALLYLYPLVSCWVVIVRFVRGGSKALFVFDGWIFGLHIGMFLAVLGLLIRMCLWLMNRHPETIPGILQLLHLGFVGAPVLPLYAHIMLERRRARA